MKINLGNRPKMKMSYFFGLILLVFLHSCEPPFNIRERPILISSNGIQMYLLPGVQEKDLDNSLEDIQLAIGKIISEKTENPARSKDATSMSASAMIEMIESIMEKYKIPNINTCDDNSLRYIQDVFPRLSESEIKTRYSEILGLYQQQVSSLVLAELATQENYEVFSRGI